MIWNWQQDDWPNFRWDARRLAVAETAFIENAGVTRRPDGFKGGLSAANYMTITGAPSATATRDLRPWSRSAR